MNRHDFVKLVAGGGMAILFAATVFGPLGFGMRYVDRLERRVQDDLDAKGIDGIDVAVARTPTLRRDIALTGNVTPQMRARAMDAARSVPGVATVRWEAPVDGAEVGSGLSPTFGL